MSQSINFTFAVPTERQAQGVKVMKMLARETLCSKTCSSDKFEGGADEEAQFARNKLRRNNYLYTV